MRHGATSAAAAGTGAAEIATALSESRRLFVAIGVFSAFVNVLMLTGPLFMLQVYDRVLTGALMRGAGRAGLRGGSAALPPDGLCAASGDHVRPVSLDCAARRQSGASRPGELPEHLADDVDVGDEGGIGGVVGVDRIARVIRSPGGFETEHDPASGDLYLRPLDAVPGEEEPPAPAVLFVGTEKGFTYRLTLTPAEGGSAQVLIRNPDAAAKVEAASASDPRIGALVRLIGAVARREPLPGYAIEAGVSRTAGGFAVVETWRGPRLTALILSLRADGARDAAAVAARLGPGIAAAWVSPPGRDGGRLAVAVRASAGESR